MPLLDLRFGDLYSPQEFARSTEELIGIAQQYRSLPEEEAIHQLWDFVCRQIKYPKTMSDRHVMSAYPTKSVFGSGYEFKQASDDFWQFPSETIAWGIGDCADTSNLLVSIASNFVPSERLYVVVGEVIDGIGHAWVEYFPLYNEKGFILETTLTQAPKQEAGSRIAGRIADRSYHEYDQYWRYNANILEGEPVIPNKTSRVIRQRAIQQLWDVPVKGT